MISLQYILCKVGKFVGWCGAQSSILRGFCYGRKKKDLWGWVVVCKEKKTTSLFSVPRGCYFQAVVWLKITSLGSASKYNLVRSRQATVTHCIRIECI